jgi:mannan endo-1,4-beta-mannosidase
MGRVAPRRRRGRALAALLLLLCASGVLQVASAPRVSASSGAWSQSASTGPSPRNRAVMVYDEAQGNVVLFGGQGPGALNDTWTWDGTTWTQQHPATSPPVRAAAGAAYDRARGRVIVFGGVVTVNGKLQYYADTWSWDGSTWTQLHPATSPPARQLANMAYDPTGAQVLLFGGHNGKPMGDTWTWNGATWTQKTLKVLPTPRVESSMATDDATSSVVLFGGFGADGTENAETWTWSNNTWTQLSPYPAPSARSGAAMAYDAVQSRMVLFGGGCCSFPATSLDGDTWTWDGTRWTLAAFTTPSARQYASAAPAGPGRSVVLFGGQTSSGNAQDTWQWNGDPPPAHPTGGILVGEYPGIGCATGPSTCGSQDDPSGANQSFVAVLDGWQGRKDAILNTYAGWGTSDDDLFTRMLPGLWNEGSIPSISWNPTDMYLDTENGVYDAYLVGFAQEMKRFLSGPDGVYGTADDRRAYLRLAWEMNGDWFRWMPARDGDDEKAGGQQLPLGPQSCSQLAAKEVAFVASWRHVHDVIVGQGLDSTRLAWDFSVNAGDADTNGCDDWNPTRGVGLMEHLFPGDAYVDWVGIDGYNWGGGSSPAQVFGTTASRLRAISSRPLAVDEVGTWDNATYPKAQWINDYFAYLSANGFRKSTWFNIDKEHPWGVFQPPTYANGNGDGTLAYGGTTYHDWNEYAAGINGATMIGADPANPRIVTDADFLGR